MSNRSEPIPLVAPQRLWHRHGFCKQLTPPTLRDAEDDAALFAAEIVRVVGGGLRGERVAAVETNDRCHLLRRLSSPLQIV